MISKNDLGSGIYHAVATGPDRFRQPDRILDSLDEEMLSTWTMGSMGLNLVAQILILKEKADLVGEFGEDAHGKLTRQSFRYRNTPLLILCRPARQCSCNILAELRTGGIQHLINLGFLVRIRLEELMQFRDPLLV
jgi:hypothetical protein